MPHMSRERLRECGLRRRGIVALTLFVVLVVCAAAPAAYAGKGSSVALKINAGAPYASSTTVTLDSTATTVTRMRFCNSGGAYTAWEAYATTKAWVLPAGDGPKTVQAQYKATGRTITTTATITLDTTGPTTTDDYSGVPGSLVTVSLIAAADPSGVVATYYRIDGGAWQAEPVVALTLRVWHKRSGLSTGVHTIDYYSVDGAGNAGPAGVCQVTLGEVAP